MADMPQNGVKWYLRGQIEEGGGASRIILRPLPFTIGRAADADLRLDSDRVSSRHAEVVLQDSVLVIRDLGSTNGTFINGERVTEKALTDGDVVHFGDQQFQIKSERSQSPMSKTMPFRLGVEAGPGPKKIQQVKDLVRLLETGAVRVEFQPLIRFSDGAIVAYEGLGRGDLDGAPSSPGELFAAAEGLGLAAELSAVFRQRQLLAAANLPPSPAVERPALFVNTHPAEMDDWETLLDSLRAFRRLEASLPIVLEIHESSVTDIKTFRALREQLNELKVQQAFDDFGTGQARLEELCEVSPDYVKFDIRFARDLHLASEKRRDMIHSLVKMMEDMDITTVVEGVENAEEAEACRALGFDLAQGYHFGRPAPLATLSGEHRIGRPG
ncbi:MAG: EAL domain-containing protein [Gemmatimonadetes bacterium]|nr:EAL domain-containing protein [Gemmatimonadota bacterium]